MRGANTGKNKRFCSSQAGSGTNPPSNSMGIRVIYRGSVILTTHLHLAPRLRKSGTIPLLPPVRLHNVERENYRFWRKVPWPHKDSDRSQQKNVEMDVSKIREHQRGSDVLRQPFGNCASLTQLVGWLLRKSVTCYSAPSALALKGCFSCIR
jgi:hypothetical protein